MKNLKVALILMSIQEEMGECPKCGELVPISSLRGIAVISDSSSNSTGKVCKSCFSKSLDSIF